MSCALFVSYHDKHRLASAIAVRLRAVITSQISYWLETAAVQGVLIARVVNSQMKIINAEDGGSPISIILPVDVRRGSRSACRP